jgi:hypothetical protein
LSIDNQLNRRNISQDQRTYLIGKRYKEEKKAIGENQYTTPIENNVKTDDNIIKRIGNSCPPKPTADKIAEQSNVSPRTVKNAEKFADAVDKLSENTGINPQRILSGEIKATQLSFLASLPALGSTFTNCLVLFMSPVRFE